MSTPTDRRSRKRQATRLAISNVATRLFIERGFERVTVDEIAAAADVGRMTVFNYFPRKEDMFFDRDEEGRDLLRQALEQRDPGVSPIEALRRLAHRLVEERSPAVEFSDRSRTFMEAIAASETLKARARAIRDEIAELVAEALSSGAGLDGANADARLAASLLLATWTTAFAEAHLTFRQRGDQAEAAMVFLTLIEKGATGVRAAMAGTPYA